MHPLSCACLILLTVTIRQTEASNFLEDVLKENLFGNYQWNMIKCLNHENLETLRMFSKALRGVTSVHDEKEQLENWVVPYDPQTFVLNLGCPRSQDILRQIGDALNKQSNINLANNLKIFRRPFSWLLLDTLEENNTAVLETLDIMLDSHVVVSKMADNQTDLKAYYKIHETQPPFTESIGRWTNDEGLEMFVTEATFARRPKVQRRNFTVAIVLTSNDSIHHLNDLVDKQIDGLAKVGWTFVELCIEAINGSIQLKTASSWGAQGKDGKWTGMVGLMTQGVVEIAASPLFLTNERRPVLDYLAPPVDTKAHFVLISPPLSYSSNIFALPFSSSVWLSCLLLLFLCSLLLYVTVVFEKKTRTTPREEVAGNMSLLEDSWSDIVLLNIGALCQQGCESEPRGPSGRIVTLILLLSVMFLYVSYSGSIVALLQSTDNSIQTLTDLINSSITCGADSIIYSQIYFKMPQTKDMGFFTCAEGGGCSQNGEMGYLKAVKTFVVPRGTVEKYVKGQGSIDGKPTMSSALEQQLGQYSSRTDKVRKELYEKKIKQNGQASNFMSIEEGMRKVQQGLFAFHVEDSPGFFEIQAKFTEDQKCVLQLVKQAYMEEPSPVTAIVKHHPYYKTFKSLMTKIHERGLRDRGMRRYYTKKPICTSKGSNFVSVGLIDCYHAFIWLSCGMGLALAILLFENILFYRLKKIQERRQKLESTVVPNEKHDRPAWLDSKKILSSPKET